MGSLIFIFAALLGGLAAIHGIDPDALTFYVAGLRVASGQVPFTDFVVSQGPLTPLLAGFFFPLFSMSGWGWVVCSALVNAITSLCAWGIVQALTKESWAAALAGIITAIWFLPPFGSLYCDHLAYSLVLAGFFLFLYLKGQLWGAFVTGAVFALAFQAKQTIGATALLAWFVAALLTTRPKDIWMVGWRLMVGWGVVQLGFVGYLFFHHGLDDYWRYVVEYSLQFASGSNEKSPLRLITFILMPWHVNPLAMLSEMGKERLLFYPVVVFVYSAVWVAFRDLRKSEERFGLLFLLLSTLWGAALLGRLHAHVFFGMGTVIAIVVAQVRESSLKRSAWGLVVLVMFSGFLHGRYLMSRVVHADPDVARTALYPVRLELTPGSRAAVEVAKFLKPSPGNFMVAGNEGRLVAALLGRAPVGYSIYDHGSLTLPPDQESRDLWRESWISQASRPDVWFVVGHLNWEIRAAVPSVIDWVKSHFDLVLSREKYLVFEKKVLN